MDTRRGLFQSAIFISFLFLISFCEAKTHSNQVCFEQHCFDVEVVQKKEDLARGLMFRESLAEGYGMLFIFTIEKNYPFWMKNTKIPLDMIWIDESRRVVFIAEHVPPCQEDPCPVYNPKHDALYVLEINAGAAKAHNIHQGSRADFKLKKI